MLELSVTQYAKRRDVSRQAILAQIHEERLPGGVQARMVGNTYVLKISGTIEPNINKHGQGKNPRI